MRINYIYIFFVLLFFFSCKKYLDEKPTNRVAVPETVENLQALLDDPVVMNRQITPSLGEASADDYFLLPASYDTRSDKDKSFYRWVTFDNYTYSNDWSLNYGPVFNSNYCLEMIEKAARNEANATEWDNVKGSALFYRSYYFLQLLWTFSKAYDGNTASTDLGIALRTTSDINVVSVRASVKQSYEKVIEDTKEAIAYLPQTPVHVYRPSKASANGLLARAYLSMREYDSAFKYSDLCLSVNDQLIDLKGDPDFNGVNASFPFKQFNKETIFYSEANLTCTNINPSVAKIDTSLHMSFAANDLRRNSFFRLNSGYYQFKGSYSASVRLFSGIATDEILLIRAECYARQGYKDESLTDVNRLMTSRHDASFVPYAASDANEALLIVLNERRKELVMRTIRWSDIKRLNKENYNIIPRRVIAGEVISLPANDNRYALPLPREIINESGMLQNPY